MATGGTITFDFKGNTKDLDGKIKDIPGKVQKSGSTVKSVLAGLGIAKVVGTAMNTISNSIDGAVKRVDTLNQFPRVMKNLGLSAEDSEKVVNDLSEQLRGLPTTLDSATSAVQRFTTKNGDVKKSEKLFLAVNDAIIAGGASADIQSSALEQLSQAYAKGKPDMMEWRTLQQAMPAQLKQVATAMGYVSDTALYEGIKSGKTSFEEMLNTIVDLDKQGTGGLASFREQALDSSGGIATSFTNLQTAVTRGVAKVIDGIDKALSDAGLGGISGVLGKVTEAVDKFSSKIVQAMPIIIKITKLIYDLTPVIIGVTSAIVAYNAAMAIMKGIQIVNGIVGTATAFIQLLPAIKSVKDAMLLLNMTFAVNPIVLIIAGIVGLIAGLVVLYAKCEWFRNLVNGLFNGIINFFKNNWKSLLLMLVNPFAGAFSLLYNNCASFRNFINGFVNSIKNAFLSLPSALKTVGKNMIQGLINGVNNAKQMAINSVKNIGKSILSGIKGVLGIHSPSTEFAWVGKMSGEGYIEGLDNITKKVQEQLNESFGLSPTMVSNASANFSPSVNVVVNNSYETDPLGLMVNSVKTFSNGAKNDFNYGR